MLSPYLLKDREPQSSNTKLLLPIIPIGIVACALTLLRDNLCRNSCIQEHDALTNFGCLTKPFNPNTLLDKFLHRLINDKIIGENIVQVRGNNLAVYTKLKEN